VRNETNTTDFSASNSILSLFKRKL
jgi:hypothetical protein